MYASLQKQRVRWSTWRRSDGLLGVRGVSGGCLPSDVQGQRYPTVGLTKYGGRAAQFLRLYEFFRITYSGIFTPGSMLDRNAEGD